MYPNLSPLPQLFPRLDQLLNLPRARKMVACDPATKITTLIEIPHRGAREMREPMTQVFQVLPAQNFFRDLRTPGHDEGILACSLFVRLWFTHPSSLVIPNGRLARRVYTFRRNLVTPSESENQLRTLKVRPPKQALLTLTRSRQWTDKMVYILVANKSHKYRNGRSRIFYIGTTKKGADRPAASAVNKASLQVTRGQYNRCPHCDVRSTQSDANVEAT